MVDSGAERSVLPPTLIPSSLIFPTTTQLSGADGSAITTVGQCTCKVAVKELRREFVICFVIAKTQPILGADFLTNHNLSLNMRTKTLTDNLTHISTSLHPTNTKQTFIRATDSAGSDSFLADNFPTLLHAPDYTSLPATSVCHAIETKGPPVFCKPRPLSPAKLEAAKAEFDHLLNLGIVQPSSSPWASPLHMVRKEDGTWRPCGDYRRVNNCTIPDRYPIPNLQHFHQRLANSEVFSKIDLVKAYHFIPVKPEHIEKTAISTPFGSFEYRRMPFGLRNSSGTFQRFIDSHLRDFNFALSYLDDILIFSRSIDEH